MNRKNFFRNAAGLIDLPKNRHDTVWNALIWGSPPRKPKPENNVKLAWVYQGEKRVMLGVDNKTMEGFAMDNKYPTFKQPLAPEAYDCFERWCTTFDI